MYSLVLEPTDDRWRLVGMTYLWMFPIYGLIAAFYEPGHNLLRTYPWAIRMVAYAFGFMGVEYVAGWLLRHITGQCPWDYAGATRWQIDGLVRLDYAPAWGALGMLLEPLHDFMVRLTPSIIWALKVD